MCGLGSHDSGSWFLDKNAPLGPDADAALREACKLFGAAAKDIVYNWSRTQGLSFTRQLQAGVRYFDLRLSTKPGSQGVYLCHGMYSVPLTSCLTSINDYLNEHQKEVVLLDMNHFYGMTTDDHDACLKSIMDVFGAKLCPYLDMESVTLSNLWANKLQVLAFYQDPSASENFYFWPGAKIPSFWPNVTDSDQLIKKLEANYARGRPGDTFNVTQGILTPDATMVLRYFYSSLEAQCADKAAPKFVKWLAGKQAGPKGINVCIMDFVHLQNYIPTLLAMNKTH